MQHKTTLIPGSEAAIPLTTPTLPELLGDVFNYESHMVGKWHLGYSRWKNTPTGRGFKSHLGYFQAQVDYYNKTFSLALSQLKTATGLDYWDGNVSVGEKFKGNYSVNQYLDRFEAIVHDYADRHPTAQDQAAEPLFIYMAHQTVHIPLESRVGTEERCAAINGSVWRKMYCSMLVELDDAIGAQKALYQSKGLWDNTLLLLTTDNGGMVDWADHDHEGGQPLWPSSAGSNWPLRGSKTTLFQGGVRGTALINGGVIPSTSRGTVFGELMHAVDLPAIALRAAGERSANVVGSPAMDGLGGLWDRIIHGAAGVPELRTDVPINVVDADNGFGYSAIRFIFNTTDYKLIVGNGTLGLSPICYTGIDLKCVDMGGYFPFPIGIAVPEPPPAPSSPDNKVLLFDLSSDEAERNDLSTSLPDVVGHGMALLKGYALSGSYQEPQGNIMHPRSLPLLHHGTWAPFLD